VQRTNSPKAKHPTLRPKRRGRISKGKLSGGCGRAAAAMDEGKKKWVAWAAAAAIFVVLMLVTPAIPQDEDYHDFADQRSLFLGTLPPLSPPVAPPTQIPPSLRLV
jgi:hypothetical protein